MIQKVRQWKLKGYLKMQSRSHMSNKNNTSWNMMKYYSISMYIQTMTNHADACLPYPIHLLDRTKMVLVAPMAICSGPSHARSTIIAFWKLSTVGLASNRMRSASLTLILWLLAVQLQIGKGFLHFVVLRQAHANPSGSSPWCLSKQRTSLQLPWGDWMATWCHSISHLCVIDCNVSAGRVFECFWLFLYFFRFSVVATLMEKFVMVSASLNMMYSCVMFIQFYSHLFPFIFNMGIFKLVSVGVYTSKPAHTRS